MMIALIKHPIRMEEYTLIRPLILEEYAHNFILSDIPWHIFQILQVSCVINFDSRRFYPVLLMLTIQTVFQDADLFFPCGGRNSPVFQTSFLPGLLTFAFCLVSHFNSASRNT